MEYKRPERRKFIRFSLDTNLKFRLLEDIDENIKAKARDVSAEGVCIVTEREIPRDKDVELDISLPGRKRPVRICGRAVWVRKIKSIDKKMPDRYEAGIKLYVMDKGDENTLLKYYCERLIDNLSQYMHL